MNTQLTDELIKDYQSGMKLTDIFKKYSTSYKTVCKILDGHGIDHSRATRKKGIPNPKNNRILSEAEERQVCQLYEQTRSMTKCEVELGISIPVISRCLKKHGLHQTREQHLQSLPKFVRKYPVNDNYFDEESAEMAYILGFLAADGSISKKENTIKIGVSSVDKELLEKFFTILGGCPVRDYITSKGFAVSTLEITSQHMKAKLAEYNIVPNKTFTFKFPIQLKKEYWRDFIRGYFDGDGCISTAGPSAIRFSIGAANKDVLEKIVDYFNEYGIEKPTIYKKQGQNNKPFYYFQYSSVPTRLIYNILYYPDCLCLSRKHNKYIELLKA